MDDKLADERLCDSLHSRQQEQLARRSHTTPSNGSPVIGPHCRYFLDHMASLPKGAVVVESEHPLRHPSDGGDLEHLSQTVSIPGSSYLRVEFDPDCDLGPGGALSLGHWGLDPAATRAFHGRAGFEGGGG